MPRTPLRAAALISVLLAAPAILLRGESPVDAVDPLIGTGKAGGCYPGAQAPFGMISWSPNTTFDDYGSADARPGYKYNRSEIYGFSLTHISGVGCLAAQDMPIMPAAGALLASPVGDPDAYKSRFSHAREEAHPGYYRVHLDDIDADAELAVSERAGFGRFSFGRAGIRSLIFRPTETANTISDSMIRIDSGGRRLSGWLKSGGFCSKDPLVNPYTIYFVAEFRQPVVAHGFWKGKDRRDGIDSLGGADVAAYVSFAGDAPGPVEMRIGLSYVSVDNAAANLQEEIPGWDFGGLRATTQAKWDGLLSRAEIGAPEDVRRVFYTALYHNLLQPSVFDDRNGDYTGFDLLVHRMPPGHHIYAGYSNWDAYRTSAQIRALLVPEEASDMATTLLIDRKQGPDRAFPRWGYFNHDAAIMDGYSGIPFIVNTWAFGGRGIDMGAMKAAMVADADTRYDRGSEYLFVGYVPNFKGSWNYSVSMTLEYSTADFAVSRFCLAAGDDANARRFAARSQDVYNLLDPQTGYLRPRTRDGVWVSPFSPAQEDGFNEGNSAQYTWCATQDMARLVRGMGGASAAERKLDSFFSRTLVDGWNTDKPYFWPGNEPSFGDPCAYCWIGRAWKAQEISGRVRALFTDGPDGLPGDDDVGATSAWCLFDALGLYPAIPGVGGFVVVGPGVNKAVLHLGGHHTLTLTAPGAGPGEPYIQRLLVDGRPSNSTWLSLAQLTAGPDAEVRFDMGAQPDKSWGTAPDSAPPSFGPTVP
jgi:predicted alpha-1,2-mannosidase